MSINRKDRVIPKDLNTLRALSRPIIRRRVEQIKHKRISLRKQAKRIGISYELLRQIMADPDKKLSRKTLMKIVRTGTRKQLVKPKMKTVNKRIWNQHTI